METLAPVAEFQSLLDELAVLIQQVERASAGGTPAAMWEQVRTHQAITRRIMDQLGVAVHEFLAARPPADLVDQVYALVTCRLRAWSRTSLLFHHILNTPRQKLGSYEVFDLLLDGRPGGADVPGLMLDNYYMNMMAPAAYRLRHRLLTQQLGTEIRLRAADAVKRHPVRLLNLHTGSGRELQELVRDRSLRAAVQVTCLDTDASALRRVKQQLGPQLAGRVDFQLGDPRNLVAARSWPDAPYDLIYALVLFDQLSDRQVEPLIAGCYRGLRPGGKLVFGNFADNMPPGEHALINWVLNLNLRRRDEGKMREIFGRTPFGAQAVSCELDSQNVSWLVSAERT